MRKQILLLLLSCSLLMGANFGRISGKVVESESGDPIMGANIIVEGIDLGAASDQEGNYLIAQIPPGKYNVRCQYIGYTPVVVKNITVTSNRIAFVNFELSPKTLDMEEVVVTAQRDEIEKDLTATTRSVQTAEIEEMPTTTITDVIRTQPGVVSAGGLHFRGGRSGEVVYMVDGVPMVNPLSTDINSSEMINKGAIAEMQMISGTYSAEYGNAMSGVINITTREGGSEFHGGVDIKNSKLGVEENSADYNRSVIRMNLNGPLFTPKTTFFMSGNFDDRDNYLPWGYRTEGNLFLKLTDKHINNLKLSLTANLSNGIHKNYSHTWKYIPDQYWYEPRSNTQMLSLGMTHTLSEKMYYTVSMFYTQYHYDSGDFDYNDLKPDYRRDENKEFYSLSYVSSYSENDQNTIGLKSDWVWYANNFNEVKAGFVAKRHNIDRFYVSSPYYDDVILDDYEVQPTEFGAYIQDKVNFSSIILSAGLRFDMHDPNTEYWDNPYDTEDSTKSVVESDVHTQVSPRLGISYPVTDRTVFHFGYGHYFQRPDYQYIYKALTNRSSSELYDVNNDGVVDYRDNVLMNLKSGNGRFGNPDLKPEKTIAYEFGVSQQLFEDYILDITVYSKQITNLLGARTYFALDEPNYWETFSLHINEDFAYNNGFEIQFRKRRGKNWTGEVNYTYAVAEGSSSGPLERVGSELENRQTLKFFPLNFDQRHTLNGRLTYSLGKFKGTLLGQWGSGLPYTKEMRGATDPYELNNGRIDPNWYLDLKLNYNLNVGNVKITPYLEVYNLTDHRNVLWVYARTGEPDYSNSGRTEEYDDNPLNYGRPRIIYLGVNIGF